MVSTAATQTDSRYGWFMVLLAPLFLAMGVGSLLCVSVFLTPLELEFGWPRGLTSFAYLVGTMGMGVGGIVMGALADRMPTRRIVLVGALTLGLCSLALSRMDSLWVFYLCYSVLGALGASAVFTPVLALVGSWFTAQRGLAIGCTTALFALIQGFMPSVVRLIITAWDWRGAYLALGIYALVVLVPLSFLVRRPGETEGSAPAPEPEPFAVRPSIAVGFVSLAVVFCCVCMAVPMVQVVALAQDRGFGPQQATGVLTVLMVAGLAGRVLIGRLADRIGGLPAYLVASFIQTLLVYGFVEVQSLLALYLVAFLFGLGSSAVMTCIFLTVQEMTPVTRWGTFTGVASLFGWTGMGLGGWLGGHFYDVTGNYTASFAIAAAAGLLNLCVLAVLWRYKAHRASLAVTPA